MYVRWRLVRQRRRGERGYWNTPAAAHALLVENVSINGRPRQRHVAYLGVLHKGGEQDVNYRAWWWHRISGKLDTLGKRIPLDQRPRIEAMLADKVRPVTAEEITALELAQQAEIRALLGGSRGHYLHEPEGTTVVPAGPDAQGHDAAVGGDWKVSADTGDAECSQSPEIASYPSECMQLVKLR
jgi:hypothetical protein